MAAQQIGQFTIVSELAQTDSGAVYKATDAKGRTVALRTVRLDAPGAAEAVAGFKAAAKAASGLASPNIAGIFGGGEAGGIFFIAVEFVEGVKLSSSLAKGEPTSMSEIVDLSRQVCYGLDHAHAKGIVHPELKPTNIIVEWDGTAKIMDFGVPRKHPAGELNEATYYLSPEEVRGEPISPRSNLFSWAAMAYQMATGKKPFDAPDAETLRRKIVEETPAPPHEVNGKLPARVSEILLKALAKAPGERYASGAELLSDLENYRKVAATPPPPVVTPVKTPTRPMAAVAAPKPAAPKPAPVSAAPAVPVVKPAPPPPRAVAPPTPKPQAAPAPAKPAAPEPPAAAKQPPAAAPEPAPAKPAAAKPAASAPSRNMLVYVMGGAILLLLGIIAGLYLRSTPAQPGTIGAPSTSASTAPAPAQGAGTTPAATPAANQPTGAPRTPRQKQQAAAPVVAAPATGGLSLDSSPPGAEVQIDGRHEASWITPFTATGLAVGPHTVNFSKAGHIGAGRTAQVTAGQNTAVSVQLAEQAATIAVNSDPAGASIALDGKDTGKVTPAQLVVAKGSHTLAVRKAGYLEASGTLETTPGQTAQFNPTLKQTGSTENIKTVGKLGGIFGGAPADSGRVSVHTNPKGAQVAVNGQPVKKTTPVDFFLTPGSYEITLTLEGYKPVKKIVDVQKGAKVSVDETLAH